MTITKEQWQKWASEFADVEAEDFARHVPLSIEASIILKTKIEAAMLCGMEMVEKIRSEGFDTTQCVGMRAALMRLANGAK